MPDEKNTSNINLPLPPSPSAAQGQALPAPVAEQAPVQVGVPALERLKLVLGGLLAATLVIINYQDPVSLLLVSGLITASALYISQKLPPLWGSGLLASGVVIAIFFGGTMSGLVFASAVALAVAYPALRTRFRGEDDHFYLAPLCLALFLVLGCALLWLFNPDATGRMIGQVGEYWKVQIGQLHAAMLGRPEMKELPVNSPEIRQFLSLYHIPIMVASLLFSQCIVSYLSIKWVRKRLGWSDPVWGQFVLFRVKPTYSLLLIAGLVVLIAAPSIKGAPLTAIAAPLLGWFFSGCLLAGLAYSNFMIMVFRLTGRVTVARFYLFGVILMVLMAPVFFLLAAALTGLLDIWFDMRKLAFTKSLLLGKGDS